jgi:signal transduction histidine kinase/DNA-binding response OmpR family regulator
MRFTLRLKLLAIVGVATIALIVVTVSNSVSEHAVEAQIDSIRDTYLPKIRLRPELGAAFERLVRTIQNAAEAADMDLLAMATADRDAILRSIQGAGDAMTAGQIATLHLAMDDYYDAAVAVSRRLIAGDGGEAATTQVQDMQAKRDRIAGLIDHITSFDEQALTAAFAATKVEQRTALIVRIVVSAICLLALLAISIWIGNRLFANLRAVIAGLERFGHNDFNTAIVSTSRDELTDVATQANRMAERLRSLDVERARHEWIRNGLAGLSDELRGELEPGEVADRTVAYLARYVQAPVAALYYRAADGPYTLLGRYAVPEGTAPQSFALGEGLVGQAATRTAITVVEAAHDAALELRSGLVATPPRAVILLPLTRSQSVTGVLELAAIRPWRSVDSELLEAASETIAITLEVAKARAAARALLDQTRQQASELEHASATLVQKADELAKASAYKSQFLANMSHELRTPLNAIIGFSELMYDGAVPLDDETRHEYLGDILLSGRHLLQLINDVLDLAKVEAGKLEFFPEPIELSRVVGEILAVLRSTSAKQQVNVVTEIDKGVEQLVLDPARLKQILYNYVSNALKFTPPKGRVTIRATAASADQVLIEVSDTGIGIAPEQVARLFADFQQTEEGARKTDGTGLGLALTKRLVEAQAGTVGVRSIVGKGSTFFAVLPRQTELAPVARAAPEVVVARTDAPVILVIEDETKDREQLVSVLSTAGYAVEAVATGSEAIARCQARSYDAVTLDLLLPDMTGLDVLQRLREGPNGDVPVVVITVVAEPGAVAGFAVHDLLAKPFAESALLESLHRAGIVPHGEGSVVLVVDDDQVSLKVMAATLGRLGYLAVCEQDPIRGLRAATEDPPSAIVLDLLMPGMTGFEFLEQLRSSETARDVPVIVWTSKDLAVDELARLRRSAHAVVSKGHEGNARVLAELTSSMRGRNGRTA